MKIHAMSHGIPFDFERLGRKKPIQEMDKSLKTAKTIAESILSGQIDPHEGADQIAQICHDLDYPDILLDLMHIAHIQEGHEHLGYYKHNLRQDILEEARKLIEKLP